MPGVNFFRKGTLLIPSGPAHDPDRRHLHVICTNPDATGSQVLVSVSSFEPGDDDTCILTPQQHGWLWKERSFVDYRYTRLRAHAELIEGVRRRVFEPEEDVNGQDFLRICRGIERSPFTPGPMRRAYLTISAAERQALTTGTRSADLGAAPDASNPLPA